MSIEKAIQARRASGYVFTERHRAALRASSKKRWSKPISAETRKKYRVAQIGRKHSSATRKRMSEAAKRRWRDIGREERLRITEPGLRAATALSPRSPSRPQISLYEGVKRCLPMARLDFWVKTSSGNLWCLDIAIPDMKLAIEYDGEYWHRNRRELDLFRDKDLEADG